MIEKMPPPCTRLLFGRKSGTARVDEMTWCRIHDHPGYVREHNIPEIKGFGAEVWTDLPAADDPRWIVYDRTRNDGYPKWDQEVLCFAKPWFNPRASYTTPFDENQRLYYVFAPIGEEPHFPGFAGSPHQRDWGILKWMLLDVALREAFEIPAEYLAKITTWEHYRREREIVVEHASENIALSVINDGHCYATWIQKRCKMGPLWIARDFADGKIIRIQAGFSAAVQQAVNYLVGRGDLERDMNVWYDALNRARFKIATYYHNHAKELT